MIEAPRLLAIADELVGRTRRGAPNQTALRRAVSTAYYALFHHIIRSAADLLIGRSKRRAERYALVYRAFDHRRMREVCKSLDQPTLSPRVRAAMGVATPPADLRDVAGTFVLLQQQRHWADYDPNGKLSRSDAGDLVDQAELAMAKLASVPEDVRKNFLVFMMTSARDAA